WIGEAQSFIADRSPADQDVVGTGHPRADVAHRALDDRVLGQDAARGRDLLAQVVEQLSVLVDRPVSLGHRSPPCRLVPAHRTRGAEPVYSATQSRILISCKKRWTGAIGRYVDA